MKMTSLILHSALRTNVIRGLLLCIFCAEGLSGQWSEPIRIDPRENYMQRLPHVGVGPLGNIAIVCNVDSADWCGLYCYTSTNGGASFVRGTILALSPPGPLSYHGGVALEVFYDTSGSVIMYWREDWGDYYVAFSSFRVSRSTDGGVSFTSVWYNQLNCNHGGSLIQGGGAQLDSNNRIHFVQDTCDYSVPPERNVFIYSKFPLDSSSEREDHGLPMFEEYFGNIDADLLIRGDTVHYVFDGYNSDSSMFYARSTDGGITFEPRVEVDIPLASYPKLADLRDNGVFLMYGSGGGSPGDSILTARVVGEPGLSPPFRLGPRSAISRTPKHFVTDSTRTHLVYVAAESEVGSIDYEFTDPLQPPVDSTFFSLHTEPDIVVDDRGGKYLVTLFDNRVYLRTKDVVTSVRADDRASPGEFRLWQNYPNPFNPKTAISFSVPHSGTRSRPDGSRVGQLSAVSQTSIIIYDLLGREVATLVNEKLEPGMYTRTWDASGMPSGVYFYRLRAGSFVNTKKLVLLR